MRIEIKGPPYMAYIGELLDPSSSDYPFKQHIFQRLDEFLNALKKSTDDNARFPYHEVVVQGEGVNVINIMRNWKELETKTNEALVAENSPYRVRLKYEEYEMSYPGAVAPDLTYEMYDVDQIGGEENVPLLEI